MAATDNDFRPTAVLAPEVEGHFDGVSNGALTGWVHRDGEAMALMVEIDGDIVGRTRPAATTAPRLHEGGVSARFRFTFPIPQELCDNDEHWLVLRDGRTGAPVLGTPLVQRFASVRSRASRVSSMVDAGPALSTNSQPGRARTLRHFQPGAFSEWGGDPFDHPLNLAAYVDPEFYLDAYPDVRIANADPVEHYFSQGWRTDRKPCALFDPKFYRRQAGLIADHAGPVLKHYVEQGWKQGLAPSARFDGEAYITAYGDVAVARVNPLLHFLLDGRKEGRQAFPADDAASHAQDVGKSTHRPTAAEFLENPQLDRFVSDTDTKLTVKANMSRTFNAASLDIHWIIPDFAPGGGGHMAIFKMISWLEFLGHRCTIWIDTPHARTDSLKVKNDIIQYFQPIKSTVRLVTPLTSIEGDVIVCTDNWTVWTAKKCGQAGATFYFVQDYEPHFSPMGTNYLLAIETYGLNLPCYCSSPWLENKMAGYGNRARSFTYPVEPDIYFPKDDPRAKADKRDEPRIIRGDEANVDADTVHVAFYARKFTTRRAVELGVLGLARYFEKNPNILVHVFGQDYDPAQVWPFPVKVHGVMTERKLAALYRQCDLGVCFSATNYSISSIEMMGCKLPLLELDTESTRATYPDDTVVMARPHPEAIAEALADMVDHPQETAARAERARDWVMKPQWEAIAQNFAEYMVDELTSNGHKARPAQIEVGRDRSAGMATVCIPTYNPGGEIAELLDILYAQKSPWPFEVMVVDSESSDGSVDLYKNYPDLKFVGIRQSEFSHGGTRNQAIAITDTPYVAFLTQDAIPTDQHWLFHLVGVLDGAPNAACAFGRHYAHEGADPFTVRDLEAHFSIFANNPPIVSQGTDYGRFAARDEGWLGFLRFFSDNNSCYRRTAWDRVKLRHIDFGEDQAYAWDAICAGFEKVYVDRAAVRHSHDYDMKETYKRARVEAQFFRDVFDVDVSVRDQRDYEARLVAVGRSDVLFAMEEGLDEAVLINRLRLNHARCMGQNLRGVLLEPPYQYLKDADQVGK